MRIIGLIVILGLSACSVANNTERHSGVGISNEGVPAKPNTPAGETDYRAKLYEDLGDT